jgi:alkylation response protein AidB-like acyl-CoA dehydrogenase
MKVFEEIERRRGWNEEERLILDAVDRLCAEVIAPRAAEIDRTSAFPWESVAAINELGLNGLFVPEAYGGSPQSYKLYLHVVKRLAEACASTAIAYATNYHAMKPFMDVANEEQLGRLLPVIAKGGLGALALTEASGGSDATAMRTTFRPDGDEIVVDGAKLFITQGDVADLTLLFGRWTEIADSRASVSALILEKGTPGFSVTRLEDKMGLRGSSTAALSFEGMRVPRANLLCEPGDGLRILFNFLNRSRPSIAAHALGIATAALKDMVAYMNERTAAKGQRIIDFQGNQFALAEMATDLAFSETWLDYLADMIDAGATDFGVEASMAKLRASDLAMRISTEAVQMHGGYGYMRDLRVERLMRDAKITQIWEGTSQVHRQNIGRSFARKV